MYKRIQTLCLCLLLALPGLAQALTEQEDFVMYQMTRGTPGELLGAAKGVVSGGITEPAVLDALAETVLQNMSQEGDWVDALAWGARALGESGNARYAAPLDKIAKAKGQASRKLRKYAKKALKQLPAGGADSYVAGSVDLDAVKVSADAAYDQMVANIEVPEGKESIAIVKAGMSQSQVMARCGPPTSTTGYVTGKAFIPFNFRGKDSVRTMLLYEGQGHIIVSNNSAYTTDASVVEVVINPSEVGYR